MGETFLGYSKQTCDTDSGKARVFELGKYSCPEIKFGGGWQLAD